MNKTAPHLNIEPCLFGARRPRRFVHGQATIEYVLVIGFAAMIGLGFLTTFSTIVTDALMHFNAVLERELVPTGFPECGTSSGQSMWEN